MIHRTQNPGRIPVRLIVTYETILRSITEVRYKLETIVKPPNAHESR